MNYKIGQEILLAQTRANFGSSRIVVVRTLMVAITEMKTGAPGFYSMKASSLPSLLAKGNDGHRYGRNWKHWPEATACDPEIVWVRLNEKDDADGPQLHELCRLYNRDVACRMGQRDRCLLESARGQPFPMEAIDIGSAKFCLRHDYIICPGDEECPECNVLGRKRRVPARGAGLLLQR